MSPRKYAALQAMAAQTVSPEEADIARAKLARLERPVYRVVDPSIAARAADEKARADLLRLWELGVFTGRTFRAGATTEIA